MQEIYLSKHLTIILDHELVEWNVFAEFVKQVQLDAIDKDGEPPRPPGGERPSGSIYNMCHDPDKVLSVRVLQRVLSPFQSSVCSEPRHRLYGLLGLIDNSENFPVDYEKLPSTIVLDAFEYFQPIEEGEKVPAHHVDSWVFGSLHHLNRELRVMCR